MPGILNRIERLTDQIDEINEEKATVEKLYEDIRVFACVQVSGALFSGSKIKGCHSSMVVKKTIKTIKIEEKQGTDMKYYLAVNSNRIVKKS